MAYKMQGFGSKAGLPKIEDDKKNKNDKQPPVQPGEYKDSEVYQGENLAERINDLEIRIENINEKYSNYDRPLTAEEKDAMKLLKGKLADLKSRRK